MNKTGNSSWEGSHDWYDKTVGSKGHYYHEKIILPGVVRLLQLAPSSRLLDIACGQGILERHIPKESEYMGIDLSTSLITAAKSYKPPKNHQFLVGDATKPLKADKNFTHAAIILALQNIEHPLAVFKNAYEHLAHQGKFVIVLNHPCFRIPRQSSWGVDQTHKIQFRRIDRYLSPLKIPILTHPGQKNASAQTQSYHYPLSAYTKWLHEAGFVIEEMEEWISDKTSEGGAAQMENRSRREFPLFLTILSRKT
jgi:ubiquinone/menaquinone biosynthesis C-methylase UbiE